MKILLVGEFSGVHTELATALKKLSCEVTTVSDGDAYKNFPRDITIKHSNPRNKIGILIYYLMEYLGIKGLLSYLKNKKTINSLKDYDVVQLINTIPLSAFGSIASYLFIRKLSRHNKKIFLCALGDDYRWVTSCLEGRYKYSALDNLTMCNLPSYLYTLKYKYGFYFKKQHNYVESICKAVIPGLLDYAMAYSEHPKAVGIIKIPISLTNSTPAKKISNNKISVFHGWQVGKELKKGNFIFDDAMNVILSNHKNIKYIVCKSIPYSDYIKRLDEADIFFDQTYSYDCGVNALLGMAHGSVVFSGFEGIHELIGVNAEPNVEKIIEQISFLIDNPEKIFEIKNNAKEYIKIHHDPLDVAQQYLAVWKTM